VIKKIRQKLMLLISLLQLKLKRKSLKKNQEKLVMKRKLNQGTKKNQKKKRNQRRKIKKKKKQKRKRK
jgi:hypothetical protein